jgi:hypothetical protein
LDFSTAQSLNYRSIFFKGKIGGFVRRGCNYSADALYWAPYTKTRAEG